MQPISPINFLNEHRSRHARVQLRRRLLSMACIGVVAVLLSSPTLRKPFLSQRIERAVSSVEKLSFFHLASSADRTLNGEAEDRINVLLLGIGGGTHDGGLLTDTIILGSIKPSTKQIAMLSFPRDMVVPIENGEWRKINSVHANAEMASAGTGIQAIRSKVEEITSLSIPYVVRVDFDGFQQLIDALGGVTIDVERVVDDPQYPIFGREANPDYYSRYEHLVIPKGLQHMDGELALKYTRSRYARGEEGSDFARARRQQKVLRAVKDKLLSSSTILSPRKVKALLDLANQHVATDMELWEMLRLNQLTGGFDTNHIATHVLDNSATSPLMDSRGIDGAYILVPRGGNFDRVQQIAQQLFEQINTVTIMGNTPPNRVAQPAPKPTRLTRGMPTVSVLNATDASGLATRIAESLISKGVVVETVGNAPVNGVQQSVVYIRNTQWLDQSITQTIASTVGAQTSTVLPSWLTDQADIIVVIGLGVQ